MPETSTTTRQAKAFSTAACLTLRTLHAIVMVAWAGTAAAVGPQAPKAAETSPAESLLRTTCVDCHNEADAAGGLNVEPYTLAGSLPSDPNVLEKLLDAIESRAMPPDDAEPLSEPLRLAVISELHDQLRAATVNLPQPPLPVSRLNRFQYNNTVRDLFQLDRDIFPLPEKLMTRHDDALQQTLAEPTPRQLPHTRDVACEALAPSGGFRQVRPFPKDLRASHGYDNQSDQLTLSPLLLDSFLHLSISLLESPDFTPETVGIWPTFFAAPADSSIPTAEIVRSRLATFLPLAFRRSLSDEILDRYTAYALVKLEATGDYPSAMKKVAAAVLSSPLFLYRVPPAEPDDDAYALAERLSFSLWGSGPDRQLLRLAADGTLADPVVLRGEVERMLADPRIERFLDAFPTQWMQLENILAATPDPRLQRAYSLDPARPAGIQMVLEPLLLFEAVFVENRPLADLITPSFSYRSEFLDAWYTTSLAPPPLDLEPLLAQNRANADARQRLTAEIAHLTEQRQALTAPVRRRAEAAHATRDPNAALAPFATWDFAGSYEDAIGNLTLQPHGEVDLNDDGVALRGGYLLSPPLPSDFAAKSLEVVCTLDNLDQPGGGLLGLQGPEGRFDTIVLGERQPRHWISGSELFNRTQDFPASIAETATTQPLHLLMVYQADGTVTLYRNGEPYGEPYQTELLRFSEGQARVLLGLRHLPPGGNKSLQCVVSAARLYDRALQPNEVTLAAATAGFLNEASLLAAMTDSERAEYDSLSAAVAQQQATLAAVPADVDPAEAKAAAQHAHDNQLRTLLQERTFRRVALDDPRYGGILTNAAMLTMTSGPNRTHPVARGVWVIEVLFNDPPPPPPNDVPPLDEDHAEANLTIRERFAAHRDNPSCAGCHSRLDPLGFALENYDLTGRWRTHYANGRDVDAAGILLHTHPFEAATEFKAALVSEQRAIARGLTEHLLRFTLGQELTPADRITVEAILSGTADGDYRVQDLLRGVLLSPRFSSFR